jgi:hypothetical protein
MHFLSEGVMQQNPRGRDTLDQLRDGPKPGLPNNFREQTVFAMNASPGPEPLFLWRVAIERERINLPSSLIRAASV